MSYFNIIPSIYDVESIFVKVVGNFLQYHADTGIDNHFMTWYSY